MEAINDRDELAFHETFVDLPAVCMQFLSPENSRYANRNKKARAALRYCSSKCALPHLIFA